MGQLFVVASERSYAWTQVPYIIDTLEAERIAAFPAWHFAAYPWSMWVCPKNGVYGASFSGQTEYCNTNYHWDLGQFSDPSYQRFTERERRRSFTWQVNHVAKSATTAAAGLLRSGNLVDPTIIRISHM